MLDSKFPVRESLKVYSLYIYDMNFDGALIKEQGIEFGIFITTMDILKNQSQAGKLIKCL